MAKARYLDDLDQQDYGGLEGELADNGNTVSLTSESNEDFYDLIHRTTATEDWVGELSATMELWRVIDGTAVCDSGPFVCTYHNPLTFKTVKADKCTVDKGPK